MKLRIGLVALLATVTTWAAERPPQYILMSFDGSYTLSMWDKTYDLAEESGAKFTYFASGVYFLTGESRSRVPGENKNLYVAPRKGRAKSAIGWGGPRKEIAQRVRKALKAVEAGHEFSSHAVGHWNGAEWTKDEWVSEFDQFHKFVLDAVKVNKLVNVDRSIPERRWQDALLDGQMHGFRAPQLGRGRGLWRAMGKNEWKLLGRNRRHRYTYDASDVKPITMWPRKRDQGFWNFPLQQIKIAGTGRRTLTMDYNFYVTQSGGRPDPANSSKYEKQMLNTYLNYFEKAYNGNRAPINIGHHFSTWNGAAYWRALSKFAKTVCNKPEVKCVTYNEFVKYMDSLTPSQIRKYERGEFSRRGLPRLGLAPRPAAAELTASTVHLGNGNVRMNIAGMPNGADFSWMVGGQRVDRSRLSLEDIHNQGIDTVSIVGSQNGNEILNEQRRIVHENGRLRLAPAGVAASEQGCNDTSHQEIVDESLL